jgi:hypothetical protein
MTREAEVLLGSVMERHWRDDDDDGMVAAIPRKKKTTPKKKKPPKPPKTFGRNCGPVTSGKGCRKEPEY